MNRKGFWLSPAHLVSGSMFPQVLTNAFRMVFQGKVYISCGHANLHHSGEIFLLLGGSIVKGWNSAVWNSTAKFLVNQVVKLPTTTFLCSKMYRCYKWSKISISGRNVNLESFR